MSCDKPLTAYQRLDGGPISFEPIREAPSRSFSLRCRRCRGCRIDKETDWTVRMVHEAQLHENSWFLTCTYSDANLPRDYSLNHAHYQKFMKRLRKAVAPQKLRFFMCGEYGSKTSRPHYHAVLFGLSISDMRPYKKSKAGYMLWQSEWLNSIWKNGNVIIGAVTPQTCAYVAGYLLKDSTDWENEYVWPHLDTGKLQRRKPPYCRMSNRPGIGHNWITRYLSEVFPSDSVVLMDRKSKPEKRKARAQRTPEYYLRLLREADPLEHTWARHNRAKKQKDPSVMAENTPARRAVRAACRDARMRVRNETL